jgi:hypothetical protein
MITYTSAFIIWFESAVVSTGILSVSYYWLISWRVAWMITRLRGPQRRWLGVGSILGSLLGWADGTSGDGWLLAKWLVGSPLSCEGNNWDGLALDPLLGSLLGYKEADNGDGLVLGQLLCWEDDNGAGLALGQTLGWLLSSGVDKSVPSLSSEDTNGDGLALRSTLEGHCSVETMILTGMADYFQSS